MKAIGINQGNCIKLYWTKVNFVDGYRIFKKGKDGIFTGFLSAEEEHAIINDINPDEEYEFKIKPYVLKDEKREFQKTFAYCKVPGCQKTEIDIIITEAYDEKLAISWIFNGEADGYIIFKDEVPFLDIKNKFAHIAMVKYSDSQYQIKSYKKFEDNYIFISKSRSTSINNESYRKNKQKINPNISIVIPAYNACEFASRCISTVLASNFKNIEIILVDDGSTDNTKDILNWYAEKYPNYIKAVFKTNGGAADARNAGIKIAKGKYIAFIDCDDMIRPDGYDKLYKAIEMTKSDIAIGQLYKIDEIKYHIRHRLPLPARQAVDVLDYMKLIFTKTFNNVAIWNKLYKTELVKKHLIPILSYEDVSWIPYILSWSDKICYIDSPCYEWDRKIRVETLSDQLSDREIDLKFQDRLKAVMFFLENGNPEKKEVLAYLAAKRLYNQGITAQYAKYLEAITPIKPLLINNRFLLEDEEYLKKLSPLLEDMPVDFQHM